MDKQPLNTGEQKDMTEFFTDLIGKIEEMSPVLVRELCFCKAPWKRTQHCWPTTPNIVGCYILRPFAHCSQKKMVKLLRQYLPTFL